MGHIEWFNDLLRIIIIIIIIISFLKPYSCVQIVRVIYQYLKTELLLLDRNT